MESGPGSFSQATGIKVSGQTRQRAGEVIDILPYRPSRRLGAE
jgi:hypothetical protein